MWVVFVFLLMIMIAPFSATSEVFVSFERQILAAQFLPCLHKKPLYSTMSNCSLVTLLSDRFKRRAHTLAKANIQLKQYMDVHSYVVIFARSEADFKLSEQSDQVELSTKALRHRTLIGWVDCRSNSSAAMTNIENTLCTQPLGEAKSEVFVFLNSENKLNHFNMSSFTYDPLEVLISLLEANFYFYNIKYESIYAEEHYKALEVPAATPNNDEERTLILFLMWQTESVFLYNFLQVILDLGPQKANFVILNDPHVFENSNGFGRQHWKRYMANPRGGNEILIYKSSNCKDGNYLVDKCEPFQIIRVGSKNKSVGLLLLHLSSLLLPKNHSLHNTVSVFDLTQEQSLSNDKVLRNLRKGLRHAESLTILIEDARVAEQGVSRREIFDHLSNCQDENIAFNVLLKPLLFITRRQLAWLAAVRFAMDLPKHIDEQTQLIVLLPNDFNRFHASEQPLSVDEALIFVKDAHFVYEAHQQLKERDTQHARVSSSATMLTDGDHDRYTMEVGDVAVKVADMLRQSKGSIPQAHLVVNLTRETYNTTLEQIADGAPALVLYHVTWDSLSKGARFVMAQLAHHLRVMAQRFNLSVSLVAQVDCFDYNDVCAREHVFEYPTLKLVQLGGARRDVYVGALSVRDLTRLLLSHGVKPWWPNDGVQVTSRTHLDTLLESSEMLADEVFVLSGEGDSINQAALHLKAIDATQPNPLLLHVASSSMLTSLLPSFNLKAKNLPTETPLLFSFSQKVQPHAIVHVLEKSTCPPKSSCALFRNSAMLQRFFPFNWRYSSIALQSGRALLILVRSAAVQSLQSSPLSVPSEHSVTRLMLELKASDPKLLTSWLDFNMENTKEVVWKFNITQLPCLILRKSNRVYLWPITKHLDSSELFASTKNWLHRVESGLEDAFAQHLSLLDERPDPRRLAFNFLDKLYPQYMASEKVNESMADLDDIEVDKMVNVEAGSVGPSNLGHDEL